MLHLRLLLLVSAVVSLAACSGPGDVPQAGNVDSNGNTVSSVPWNKPESWESNGQLGQMAQ